MKFSIVIPAWERDEPLRYNLWRMANLSTYPKEDYEVIIGDAYSYYDDRMQRAAKDFSDQLNIVCIDFGRDGSWRNPAPHRNRLFREASGEVVIMLDVDYIMSTNSLWELDKWFFDFNNRVNESLREIVIKGGTRGAQGYGRPAKNSDEILVYGLVNNITPQKQEWLKQNNPDWWKLPFNEAEKVCDRPGKGGNIWLWATKKKNIEKAHGYDERLVAYGREDCSWALQLQENANCIPYRERNFKVITFDHAIAGPNNVRDSTHNNKILEQNIKNNMKDWPGDIKEWGIIETSRIVLDYRDV